MKKLYGVIGDPIAQSMSPDMHNDAFCRLQLDAHYHAFRVAPADLEAAVKGLKSLGVHGFNVTVPHKTAIMPYLDRLDSLAAAIGAVNTVKWEDGGYTGYNTDGLGYISGLKPLLVQPLSSHNVCVVGAGGAAKAIFHTLIREGAASIDVANRTVGRAESLASSAPSGYPVRAIGLAEAEHGLSAYSLIINTTSIGMKPKENQMPLSLDRLQSGTLVSDIVYNPLETVFLAEAKTKGALVQNGLPMFVHQGALALRIWTGIHPDINRMESIVLRKLGG
ncbi:MAG: shikimate dehydrogenase [Bacillus sp. (in: firmicutes)]